MFCSKCGKTIHAADSVCPNCGAPIGDNRFDGVPYTSAQFTIAPGQKSFEPLNNYTRTTYTSMGDAAQEGSEIDSRTTYRPVYEGASAPSEVRRDMRARVYGTEAENAQAGEGEAARMPEAPLSQMAQDTLEKLDEELQPDENIDREQFRTRPIQSAGRAGISRDVSEYIRQLEDNESRRSSRRRNQPGVYDDFNRDAQGLDEEYADENEIDDVDYDDLPRGRFGVGQVLKVVIALAVVAAIIVGGITWLHYVRGNQSSAPIEGVSESFYDEGIALIKSRVESAYINDLVSKYTADGMLTVSSQIEADKSSLRALMPAEPAANDQTFLNALLSIQDNIGNSVIMDALSAESSSDTALADSQARWTIVNNSIAQLESARSAAELTAIINGQTITVQTETPAPTEAPVVYPIKQKGDEDSDVMKIQIRLYELGYLQGDRDGVYGSKTQTAVKMFQEQAGITASGIADNETQQRLYAEDAPYRPGTTTPTPATPEPTQEPQEQMIQPAEMGDSAQADSQAEGTQAA